jgi:uroporphyrinogen-III synthase
MREVPLQENSAVFSFAEKLFRGDFDMMILLTGVGTRLLNQILDTRYPPGALANALRRITGRHARTQACRSTARVGAHSHLSPVPEPNTWRELLAAIDGRPERRIACSGIRTPRSRVDRSIERSRCRGHVGSVYVWDLPENCEPLREAVAALLPAISTSSCSPLRSRFRISSASPPSRVSKPNSARRSLAW